LQPHFSLMGSAAEIGMKRVRVISPYLLAVDR
jgi:hypothetical protein